MGHVLKLQEEIDAPEASWIELPTSTRIVRVVQRCAEDWRVAIIRAVPGAGKTYALRHAISEGIDSAVLVTLNPACSSLSTGLPTILDGLLSHPAYGAAGGDRPASWYSGKTGTNMRRIMKMLDIGASFFEGPPVLIVDEAQWAAPNLLGCCRYLYDEGLCSLIVSGNHDFAMDGLEPLVSRAHYEISADRMAAADIEAFCQHHRIIAADGQAIVGRIAAERGLRGAEELLRRARAAGGDPVPRCSVLRDVARTMTFASAPSRKSNRRRRG